MVYHQVQIPCSVKLDSTVVLSHTYAAVCCCGMMRAVRGVLCAAVCCCVLCHYMLRYVL